jgi:F-type H+-transporting ATPase subunit a
MSTRTKVLIGLGTYVALIAALIIIFGATRAEDTGFAPQNEFKLDTWVDLPGPLDLNKGVFFVILAGILMTVTMLYVANRMQARPNRVQTLVEIFFTAMRDNVTKGNMDSRTAAKWFPFIGALFLFIWFSNMLGYLPLPTNTEHKFSLFGLEIPSFAIYAATANISVPLVLALIVWLSYNAEGIRRKGFAGYLKGLVPAGVTGGMAAFIFVLELFSNIMRLVSLSVRLFANILAGHLLILFMSGALVVLLGIEAVGIVTLPAGVILFLFEIGLVATLQAFIFATLTAIYLGGAVAEEH